MAGDTSPTMSASDHAALAQRWIDAFNAHDVAALVALYGDDCTHTSPKIRVLHPDTGGKIVGKTALTRWWTDAMERLPGLRYEATAIVADEARVIIEYVRHAPNEAPMFVAEAFDIAGGRIAASRVYHG
jgi:steroid delta-isomerase-like uncharacterized protein